MKNPLKSLKNLVLGLVVCAASMAAPANAQSDLDTIGSSTTSVPAQASNIVAGSSWVVAVPKSRDIAFQVEFTLSGAGTSGVAFQFDSSLDNSTWFTNSHRFWIPGVGTGRAIYNTNWTINALPYLRLNTIHNTNNAVLSNLVVKINRKIGL